MVQDSYCIIPVLHCGTEHHFLSLRSIRSLVVGKTADLQSTGHSVSQIAVVVYNINYTNVET